MEELAFSANAVLPLFFVMALGYALKRTGFLNDTFLTVANKFSFKVTFPALLFYNIYSAQLPKIDGGLIAAAALGVVGLLLLSTGAVLLFVKDNARRGVIVQAVFRSNFLVYGTPLAVNMFGDTAQAPAAMLVAIIIPLYNVLAVIVLTVFGGRGERLDVPAILKGIVTNPLIIASALALLLAGLHMPLPPFLLKATSDVGSLATPLALVILGGQFTFGALRGNGLALTLTTAARLVAAPALMLTIAVLLGFRGLELGLLAAVFASPVAISSQIMAQNMGGDGQLAGQLVIVTTLFSIPTIFLVIYTLRLLQLI